MRFTRFTGVLGNVSAAFTPSLILTTWSLDGTSLDRIEANVPSNRAVHLVMDTYATHTTQMIQEWLARRSCCHGHLTPASASWLNQVTHCFALITETRIRRGVDQSNAYLKAAIVSFTG